MTMIVRMILLSQPASTNGTRTSMLQVVVATAAMIAGAGATTVLIMLMMMMTLIVVLRECAIQSTTGACQSSTIATTRCRMHRLVAQLLLVLLFP